MTADQMLQIAEALRTLGNGSRYAKEALDRHMARGRGVMVKAEWAMSIVAALRGHMDSAARRLEDAMREG